VNDVSVEEAQIQDIVYALATSPAFTQTKQGVCFAARFSGLYRSDDGGSTWRFAYDSLNLTETVAATTVVLSPDFETDQTVFVGAPGGVLHSVDGGKTWYVAMLPSPPPTVSTLVVSPNFTRDGVLLAGTTDAGVFRSADRGTHWAAWNFGLLDLSIIAMAISPDFANDETLYAGTDSGIFRSTNGGRAWREVDLPIGFEPVLSLALSPNYAQDGILFAGTESRGLFHSTDRGKSWFHLGKDAITDAVNTIVLSPDYPAKQDILVMLSNGLLISRNNGQSWSDWKADLHLEQGLSAVAAPQGLEQGAPLLLGLVDKGALRLD
jgi:photosystem II stability/assembly factor-like uncharacterized protein